MAKNKSNVITQLIGVKVSPSKALAAVSTTKGISGWWSKTVKGEFAKGKTFDVIFDTNKVTFKPEKVTKSEVVWKCTKDDYGMAKSKLTFSLKRKGSETLIFMKHTGLKAKPYEVAFMTTKWAIFMLSMRDYLEKGRGRPFPRDQHLMHGDFG
jgi:hypothetical protein